MLWEAVYHGIESGGVSYNHDTGVSVSVRPSTDIAQENLDGVEFKSELDANTIWLFRTAEWETYFEIKYEGETVVYTDFVDVLKILRNRIPMPYKRENNILLGLPNLDLIRSILIGARFLKMNSPQDAQKLEAITEKTILDISKKETEAANRALAEVKSTQ